MYKKFKSKLFIYLLLLITILFYITLQFPLILKNDLVLANTDSINIILDNLNYDKLPTHLRSTSDLKILANKNINLNGLDKLNISGSQQFSKFNIDLILNFINTSLPITDVDLRQESHGFVNGLPISFANKDNNANKGLSLDKILLKEDTDLKSIKLKNPLTFYNHPDMTITPTEVETESKLAKDKSLSYIRVAVTDGAFPTDEMVDYFIKSVQQAPKNAWFHFHCKEGIGRTTTFMIMYDMMKNYKVATANEIINRQISLANFDANEIKDLTSARRLDFWQKFYEYCEKNGDNFTNTYSDFIKSLPT